MIRNFGVAGGVIRDRFMKVIVVFCVNLGPMSSNEEEARAMHLVLKLTSSLNLFLSAIVMDSLLIVQCIQQSEIKSQIRK